MAKNQKLGREPSGHFTLNEATPSSLNRDSIEEHDDHTLKHIVADFESYAKSVIGDQRKKFRKPPPK